MTEDLLPGRALTEAAESVLRRTDLSLRAAIEARLGVAPTLDVVWQSRLRPPHPDWLAPPLDPDAELLVRRTSFRWGAVVLSRNLALVDLGLVNPEVIADLEGGRLHLGQVFTDPRIERVDFQVSTGGDDGLPPLRELVGGGTEEYVWRRYRALLLGRTAFVVIEALPVETWRRLTAPRT